MQHQFYSLYEIAEIVNGQLVGEATDMRISDLLIDSRHLMDARLALFFALTSARNDGHKYIKELYDRGVRAFVVKRPMQEQCPEAVFIVVTDTLKALQTLAAHHRQQFVLSFAKLPGQVKLCCVMCSFGITDIRAV